MAVPNQELPQSRAQETLSTSAKLSDLSGTIDTMSPAFLDERSNELAQSWDQQQVLATQVPANQFNNPYMVG